jgi:hypothetical protein
MMPTIVLGPALRLRSRDALRTARKLLAAAGAAGSVTYKVQAILLAKNSGSGPFDEMPVGRLVAAGREALMASGSGCATARRAAAAPPLSCVANHKSNTRSGRTGRPGDLPRYLRHIGWCRAHAPASEPPSALCKATPLAGSETLHAAAPGVGGLRSRSAGASMRRGATGRRGHQPSGTPGPPRCAAGVAGVLYARCP